jgi:hypothetical protein
MPRSLPTADMNCSASRTSVVKMHDDDLVAGVVRAQRRRNRP